MRLGPLLAKDARLLARNRALLAALLLYPLLLAATLGAAFQEPPTRLDLVVHNGDAGGAVIEAGGEQLSSDDLVASASAYATVENVTSEQEALAAVRRGDADAALLIPRGFVDDLSRLGSSATLRVVVDESDPVRANVARSAVVGGIEAFVKSLVQRKIDDVMGLLNLTIHGGTTRVVFIDVEVLGIERSQQRLREVQATLDPGSAEHAKVQDVITFLDFALSVLGNSQQYLVTTAVPVEVQTEGLVAKETSLFSIALPGAIVLSVFWTGSLAAALLISRERETGAIRRLRAAHAPPGLSGLSKGIVATLVALLPALVLLAIGVVGFGATLADPALALLVLLLASLAAAALGALAAGIVLGSSASALLVVLALLPMLLLGGLFYPVAYMPEGAQAVARALPVTQATDALRGGMLRASGLDELALPLAGLAAFALVAAAVGALLGRRGR